MSRPSSFIPLPMSEEELAARILRGQSIRGIGREIGMDQQTLRSRAAPVIERLRLTHRCDCGRPVVHRGGCSPDKHARRHRIIAMIMQGMTYQQIATIERGNRHTIRKTFERYLTPAQRAQRQRMQKQHWRRGVRAQGVNPAHRDDLYQRLSRSVPSGIPADLRDDIISEMYLATLEGTATVEQAVEGARRFVSREYGKWASRFGPVSLNEMRDDWRETALNRIEDPGALAAFSQFDDMQLGGVA